MNAELAIHAVSVLAETKPKAIRRAEELGLIPPAVRTDGGHRRWCLSEVQTIKRVMARRRRRPRGAVPE